jgi:Sec-independent protein translocase protein TatA
MLSVPDMAIAGVVALLLFGPDQLPKVARKAGAFVRDIQNTSQSFIREMERAADEPEPYEPPETPEPGATESERPGAETPVPGPASEPQARSSEAG